MMPSGWEVVHHGKNKKPNKLTKAEKGKLANNVPKLNKNDPKLIKPGRVVFTGDENANFNDTDSSSSHDLDSDMKPEQKTNTFSVPEAMGKISADKIKSIYEDGKSKSPGQPIAYLLNIVAYINTSFPSGFIKDESYSNEPNDFPMVHLSPATRKVLKRICDDVPKNVRGELVMGLLKQIFHNVDKGGSTIGHRLVLQVFLRIQPFAALISQEKVLQLMRDNKQHPVKFKITAWALKQAALSNFGFGCQIWLNMLVPMILTKNLSETVIAFGEQLFKNVETDKSNSNLADAGMNHRHFLPLLDLAFYEIPEKNQGKEADKLSPLHRRRLIRLYNNFKDYVFTNQSPQLLKNYFPSLFVRLKAKQNPLLNNELLNCTTYCLVRSPDCFKIWAQTHAKYPEETSVLLQHIVKRWKPSLKAQFHSVSAQDCFTSIAAAAETKQKKQYYRNIAINAKSLIKNDRMSKLASSSSSRNQLLSNSGRCNAMMRRLFSAFLVLLLVGAVLGTVAAFSMHQDSVTRWLSEVDSQYRVRERAVIMGNFVWTQSERAIRLAGNGLMFVYKMLHVYWELLTSHPTVRNAWEATVRACVDFYEWLLPRIYELAQQMQQLASYWSRKAVVYIQSIDWESVAREVVEYLRQVWIFIVKMIQSAGQKISSVVSQ